jgi:hypothetical protein
MSSEDVQILLEVMNEIGVDDNLNVSLVQAPRR